ncbi:MAG: dehydrogenase E1 component subunit alpha/beta [Acidobacteria bacterium]|nr:dehydrogenase E1 component subunit alpha/beta [Acidobacteriota bacterium]
MSESSRLRSSYTSPVVGLSSDDLLQVYRLMYLSRRLDDRELILKRQNQAFFQISCAGHEAIQVAAGMHMRRGVDWLYPYYRDRAICLTLGVTPLEMLLQTVGAAADPASGGRQMPTHWSFPELNIVTPSSATGTQCLQAVGCAHASRLAQGDEAEEYEVTVVCAGEGSTSEGEFWESINAASLEKLPLLYLIEDNGYAISVPVEAQTPGGSISKLLQSFPGLSIYETDGSDFQASFTTLEQAFQHCLNGGGPALVHAHVTRPYGHSQSDDVASYKTPAEREEEDCRDAIQRFADVLLQEGIAKRTDLLDIQAGIEEEVQRAAIEAVASPPPKPETVMHYLYSPDVDPTSAAFSTEAKLEGEPRTMVDLINVCMDDEMARDERIYVFGEDVADCSREENLEQVKGKGGVFKATLGLQRKHGGRRVFNSPIAEAAIVGRGTGMATRGLKPVVEIQFFDYIWPAMMQIRDELASLRWRSNNGFSAPFVMRVPIGGYLNGGSVYHSQSGESTFTHIPGLRVIFPSNARDANGLLRTAIRCDDPVLFLEHKKLYRETYNRSQYPGPDYMVPFGKAAKVREGNDLTVVTYGALVQKSMLAAANIAEETGASIEVLDLRSLSPYDWEAIAESVKKTSRVIVVHEDMLSWGFGSEISARIASELFDYLDAPIGRIGAMDVWVAYRPELEREILPQTKHVEAEMRRILAY